MNLQSITPFFIDSNLRASVQYYIDKLGFELEFEGPTGDVNYAQVRRDNAATMLKCINPEVGPVPNHTRHEWARWDAYIYTSDPDTLYAEHQGQRVSFVKELSSIDDGLWGFEVSDADGYVLAFFCLKGRSSDTATLLVN